jgi:hypothetical protein
MDPGNQKAHDKSGHQWIEEKIESSAPVKIKVAAATKRPSSNANEIPNLSTEAKLIRLCAIDSNLYKPVMLKPQST